MYRYSRWEGNRRLGCSSVGNGWNTYWRELSYDGY